ncbi:spore gernimation protein [Paenibacillus pectinilyticus]|uniref:Spore gernimation protein n=1 Tax=Paenibacillus pectinilyticus TaxID=512399 RepID=A0A1C1A5P0_9BACL|nr:glycoside hydrolase family 18 protein [Paenibacillus pectinilyticus]OCT15876.1 spore gernimation protein [Paenibacillus pectinilyticus]
MQIHVVQKGQTLYRISQTYGVSVDEVAAANELTPNQSLVIGQAMVIPIVGSFYWIQPGEALYRIAQKLGIDLDTLASVNGISPYQPLPSGFRLYIPPTPRRQAEVNAYIEPRGEDVSPLLVQAAHEAAPHLTYLAPFSFRIKRDGTLVHPPLNHLREITQQFGVTLMMVVTNLENDQFSAELGHLILTDEAIQTRLLQNIETTADQLGFKDIHFDIEHLLPADREAYNNFLRKAVDRFHRKGYLVSTALAPKTSATQAGAWYEAHDYKAHGQIVDFVIIMTYEWGYSGGPPMAVSPIGPVRKVLEYARSEMPANKIMMGQNLYGYDWTLPYVKGGAFAKAISPQAAIDLARKYNAQILYDHSAQAPHFNYWDDAGKEHTVWFEDARSLQAKFRLLTELGLRGISYWKLGLKFPQNWLLLEDHFKIVKRS